MHRDLEKDLIEIEAAIKSNEERDNTFTVSVLQQAYKRLKATQWIPCFTEVYPECGKYVLLSFENFSIPCVGRYEEDEEGGAFYIGDEDETCSSQDMFVNAWMPLPEAYGIQ